MTHYEEFGLMESASVEEIRQAYKSLARLLHPDHQCEDQLRKLAELQMIRLNEILAVLTDSRWRAKYDRSIRSAAAATAGVAGPETPEWKLIPVGPFRLRAGTIARTASLVMVAVGFSFALPYFEPGAAVPVYQGNVPPRTLLPPADVAGTSPMHARVGALGAERRIKRIVKSDQIDPPEVAPLARSAAPHDFEKTQMEEPRTSPSPAIALVADMPDPIRPPPGSDGLSRAENPQGPFVGTWLYSKTSAEAATNSGMAYRPEYVEMIVKSGDRGNISGRYLGRFHVPDQALSSEISFAFEGKVGEEATVLTWHSGDGAEGKVRLKIVSSGATEVTWYTTRVGTTRKLASGTAVLRRD